LTRNANQQVAFAPLRNALAADKKRGHGRYANCFWSNGNRTLWRFASRTQAVCQRLGQWVGSGQYPFRSTRKHAFDLVGGV